MRQRGVAGDAAVAARAARPRPNPVEGFAGGARRALSSHLDAPVGPGILPSSWTRRRPARPIPRCRCIPLPHDPVPQAASPVAGAEPRTRPRIDWRNHLVELAAVFAGFTAAFLLNTWREERSERRAEHLYLRRLLLDVTLDADSLADIVAAKGSKTTRLAAFIESLRDGEPRADEALTALAEVMANRRFNPKRITYDSLTNTGSMGVIAGHALKEANVEYYIGFRDLQAKEAIVDEYLKTYGIPFAYQHMDILTMTLHRPDVARDQAFRNLVVRYLTLSNQNL